MTYEISLVNSFTGVEAEGNPAGVLISQEELDSALMQELATLVGFSETAFVTPLPEKSDEYRIRWFTTVTEVPLCGHATLAAAAVIFRKRGISSTSVSGLSSRGVNPKPTGSKKIRFHSQSGILEVSLQKKRYVLDFPLDTPIPYDPPENLLTAMSIESYVSSAYGKLTNYLLIQLQNEERVADLSPNFSLLKGLNLPGIIGIIATAIADSSDIDFVSRFFDPWAGIMEDPVTGSAHSLLTPYWQQILKKREMTARQISSRGGVLYLQVKDDKRVFIGGSAEIYAKKILSVV